LSTAIIPMCLTQLESSIVRIDNQEDLDGVVGSLNDVHYNQSKCVTLNIHDRENYSYKIDLVELLKISSNFVITGLGLQQVKLKCTGASNDTQPTVWFRLCWISPTSIF